MTGVASNVRVRELGSYVLGRRIGSGGMATVFAARQAGGGLRGATRVVAVKVMSTALADDPAARRMFEREATIATRVEHPNVVRTYEVGEVRGEIFMAMELVQGAPLSTLCSRAPGAVPLSIAIRIACDVARGLTAVHDLRDAQGELLGVVHQDVTPHNVVVGYDGVTKLLDFGVARIVLHDGSRTGTVRGKPSYLAPEQRLLERVDSRADVYGLGAVLFELVTGTRSSHGVESFAPRPPIDVRSLRADVPDALARVIAKALAVDPDERFPSADAMRRALTEAAEASGLTRSEESDVGAWAIEVSPPTWSLADLERELSLATEERALALDDSYRAELAAVAELPTIMDKGISHARESAPLRKRTRLVAVLAALVLVFSALGAWRFAIRHSSSPALALLAPIAGQAAPSSGVHLFVTLDRPDASAWAHVAFDHITVTVTSGDERSVVCLTPRAEGQRAFPAHAPSPDDLDPCADLHAGGFAGVNGVYPPSTFNDDWDLVTNPWELDFSGPPDRPIAAVAEAIFGGAAAMRAPLGVMRARGQAVASASFPRIDLAFAVPAPGTYWGNESARCDQGTAIASWLDLATFSSQPANPVACPRTAKGLAFTESLRSVATTKLGTVGRIPAAAGSTCSEGESDGVIVWKSDLVPITGCVSLFLTGRFASCAAGEPDESHCATSVRCVPPRTDLVALSKEGKVLKSENISCVPSYPEPIQYVLTFDDAGAGAGAVALGLRRTPPESPLENGCFFDLYDFSVQQGCSLP